MSPLPANVSRPSCNWDNEASRSNASKALRASARRESYSSYTWKTGNFSPRGSKTATTSDKSGRRQGGSAKLQACTTSDRYRHDSPANKAKRLISKSCTSSTVDSKSRLNEERISQIWEIFILNLSNGTVEREARYLFRHSTLPSSTNRPSSCPGPCQTSPDKASRPTADCKSSCFNM